MTTSVVQRVICLVVQKKNKNKNKKQAEKWHKKKEEEWQEEQIVMVELSVLLNGHLQEWKWTSNKDQLT